MVRLMAWLRNLMALLFGVTPRPLPAAASPDASEGRTVPTSAQDPLPPVENAQTSAPEAMAEAPPSASPSSEPQGTPSEPEVASSNLATPVVPPIKAGGLRVNEFLASSNWD